MSDTINDNLETLRALFQSIDQALNEWTGEGNLQVPVLLGMMAVRFNWNEKQVRENDPFVRFHVRNHPDWHITRGAGGGIMRASEKQKKEAIRLAKELAKKQMADALEAQAAAKAQATAPSSNQFGIDNLK
jgi:hypothetical protein